MFVQKELMFEKELKLIIQPNVIDHLGIKMYQKSVDVIAEFVANAWDADSETVEITIKDSSIEIKDNGIGMSFEQCQDHFLIVGRDRRKDTGKDLSEGKNRPILGRKGIGKFSGFGIAKKIEVLTISKSDGELTYFEMDIDDILKHDARRSQEKPIKIMDYKDPNIELKKEHGTTIILKGIDTRLLDLHIFKEELSRRFLLSQLWSDFLIRVNGESLPESFADTLEFVFPIDLTKEEKAKLPYLKLTSTIIV